MSVSLVRSKSVEYSEGTLEEALKKVQAMDADLGGTEIFQPLKHIYSQTYIPNQPRQVTSFFFLETIVLHHCICFFYIARTCLLFP